MVKSASFLPTTFDPHLVCAALDLDAQMVRTVITEPHEAKVELIVCGPDGEPCVQGDDVLTVWITLRRQ